MSDHRTAKERRMKEARDEELAKHKRLLEDAGVPSRTAEREATKIVDTATELYERRQR